MRKLTRYIFNINFLYILLIAAQVAAIVFLCVCLPAFLPTVFAVITVWALSAATAALILSRADGDAEIRCVWLALIMALPVAGAVICLICAVNKKRRGVLLYDGGDGTKFPCGTAEAGYDDAVYFPSGAEFFSAVLAEMERAKDRIYIEFFIIGRGRIFERTLATLKRAAERGVKIRIIADGFGSAFKAGRREFGALKKIAEVKVFHPIVPLPLSRLNIRDHRKIVTVDGRAAFTGGINLADEYANITSPYGYWKDSGVAVYGGAAKVFEGMFLSMWNNEQTIEPPKDGKYSCLPYCDSPPGRSFCENAYLQAIYGAKRRVHAMTPYFGVSEKLSAALAFAAARGVEVKIIIPHIPDKRYAFTLSRASAAEVEESGVRFYEYTPGFLHAKCLICDDEVFLGSYNLDSRSMRYNYECGIMFRGEITEDAERDFCECLALSAPLSARRSPLRRHLSRLFIRIFAPLI